MLRYGRHWHKLNGNTRCAADCLFFDKLKGLKMENKTLGQIVYETYFDFFGMSVTGWSEINPQFREAHELMAQAVIEAHEARKWKPIENKDVPKDGSQIYVDAPELDCGCSIAYFDDGAWRSAWDGRVFVDYAPTHWQPLPAPPAT